MWFSTSPVHLSAHVVVALTSMSFTSSLVTGSPLLVLRLVLDRARLFLSNKRHRHANLSEGGAWIVTHTTTSLLTVHLQDLFVWWRSACLNLCYEYVTSHRNLLPFHRCVCVCVCMCVSPPHPLSPAHVVLLQGARCWATMFWYWRPFLVMCWFMLTAQEPDTVHGWEQGPCRCSTSLKFMRYSDASVCQTIWIISRRVRPCTSMLNYITCMLNYMYIYDPSTLCVSFVSRLWTLQSSSLHGTVCMCMREMKRHKCIARIS